MDPVSYEELLEACKPGGASILSSTTHLQPAGGWHTSVAPAKYVSGNSPTFGFEKRFIEGEGEAQDCVLLASKQHQLHRAQDGIAQAIDDGHPILSRTPRIELRYHDNQFSDLTLPHRAFDAHIRAGETESGPVTSDPRYRELRNSSPANARPLLETSPVSLLFGAWDSSRKAHQVRQRSCLVGEIIGVLADQSGETVNQPPKRGGARIDPLAAKIAQDQDGTEAILEKLEAELSPKLVKKVRDAAKKSKSEPMPLAALGLGAIPPSLNTLGGVACKDIIRTHVLSFAALRQLRFGAGPDGDAACRALLAALALNGLARSDSELLLRANCDLVEVGPAEVLLDQRHGQQKQLSPLTIDEADSLLNEAIKHAEDAAGIQWNGVAMHVTGNETIYHGISAEDTDD